MVYRYTGWLAPQGIPSNGSCFLRVDFLDEQGVSLQDSDLPGHYGTRGFAFDFPTILKLRAPDGAAFADIQLAVEGVGEAWFDDIMFGPAPLGSFSGTVTSDGVPLEGAKVDLLMEHWGKTYETLTDENGDYVLEDVPVALPRYILLASKEGFGTRTAGQLAIQQDESTVVDFLLEPGDDLSELLQVRFSSVDLYHNISNFTFPDTATIPDDEEEYPDYVRTHLRAGTLIDPDNELVVATADTIRATLTEAELSDTRAVNWAVYQWLTENMEFEEIFRAGPLAIVDEPWLDQTAVVVQDAVNNSWSWGTSHTDTVLRPEEMLETRSGTCTDFCYLGVALLRQLGVPARVGQGSLESWYQTPEGEQGWIQMQPQNGRTTWREAGELGEGFERIRAPYQSVDPDPVLAIDWNAETGGIWRAVHPWEEYYGVTDDELALIQDALDLLAQTGDAVDNTVVPETTDEIYRQSYKDVTIALGDLQGQSDLIVRFPMTSSTELAEPLEMYAYWTNRQDCLVDMYIEPVWDDTGTEVLRWATLVFDLSSLF